MMKMMSYLHGPPDQEGRRLGDRYYNLTVTKETALLARTGRPVSHSQNGNFVNIELCESVPSTWNGMLLYFVYNDTEVGHGWIISITGNHIRVCSKYDGPIDGMLIIQPTVLTAD